MRSFIAIELPDRVRSALSEFQQELKKCGTDVRWVKPESIHLTLKFLGNISDNDADKITKIIEGTIKNYSCFDLQIRGAGVFPNVKAPRVLWIGVSGNEILHGFQEETENRMASIGFEKENRKFSPHLTLGRLRSSYRKESLIEKIEMSKDMEFGIIHVEKVALMKSELSSEGAKYSRIVEFYLKKD